MTYRKLATRTTNRRPAPIPAPVSAQRRRTVPDGDIVGGLHLPRLLQEPVNFCDLHAACNRATRYATAVFNAAIGIGYARPSHAAARRMSDTTMCLYSTFDRYWARHRGEMAIEEEMAEDDVGSDRVPAWVACFLTSTIAMVAGACISECCTSLEDDDEDNEQTGTKDPYERFEIMRDDVPFAQMTTASFSSVMQQRVAQTSKKIIDYDEWDIVEALESIGHAWRRLRIDADIEAYVTALRLRFGMLVLAAGPAPIPRVRTATTTTTVAATTETKKRQPLAEMTPTISASAAAKQKTETLVANAGLEHGRVGRHAAFRDTVRSRDGKKTCGVPSTRCVGEMAARFLAFAEMRSVSRRNAVGWSPMAARRFGIPDHGRAAVGGRYVIEFADRIGKMVDIEAATYHVARSLLLYAQETEHYGSIPTSYRRRLAETYVSPGEPGVLSTRDPHSDSSTKSVLRMMRGGRFFGAVCERSQEKPAAVLARALTRLVEDRGGCVRNDLRSLSRSDEEFAALCAIHTLFGSRFGIDWSTWFLVTRATYRELRKTRDIGGDDALPVILIAWNTYDVLYRDAILRTSSLFESLAWWLAILRFDHASGVVAANESGKITVRSPAEIPNATIACSSDVGTSINLDTLPVSSSVLVSIASLCDVVTDGPKSFVTKVNGIADRQFVEVAVGWNPGRFADDMDDDDPSDIPDTVAIVTL